MNYVENYGKNVFFEFWLAAILDFFENFRIWDLVLAWEKIIKFFHNLWLLFVNN